MGCTGLARLALGLVAQRSGIKAAIKTEGQKMWLYFLSPEKWG